MQKARSEVPICLCSTVNHGSQAIIYCAARTWSPSEGPISVTRLEREKEKGKKAKELISKHKLIRKINSKYTLYCSPGHFIRFNNSKIDKKLKTYLFKHQLKKSFQYSLEWEKNQLAIWDNRSMLHQATAFKGNRIMHRITVQ